MGDRRRPCTTLSWKETASVNNNNGKTPPPAFGRVSYVVAVAAELALGACFQGPEASEIRHPTPENAPPADAVQITQDSIPSGMEGEALANWLRMRDELTEVNTALRIGAKETDGPDAFGNIADVTVSPSGNIFVLDEQAQEVLIFDSNGSHIQSLGGIGDGPTEFRYANGIALLAEGTLVVSSRGPQLKLFGFSDGTWQLDSIIRVPAISRDACFTKDRRIFVTGYKQDNNTLVHEVVDSLDDGSRDFGEGYRDDQWLVQMRMGEGIVECLDEPLAIVFAFRGRPLVRAHHPDDGSVVWSAVLVDFVPEPVLAGVQPTGQAYVRYGQVDEWDVMGAVHEVRPGYLLLQTARVNSLEKTVVVRSYLIDATSGQGGFVGDTLPRIFPTLDGHVAVFEDPYPRLEVRVSHNKGDQE